MPETSDSPLTTMEQGSGDAVALRAFRVVRLRQHVDGAEYSGLLAPSESRTVQARWRAPDEDPPERMAERSVPGVAI